MEQTSSKKKLFPSIVFISLLLVSNPTSPVIAKEEETEFDYIEGSEKGPSKWGDLNEDWAACKNGTKQSPIDISSRRVKLIHGSSGDLHENYKPSNTTLHNSGHDISLSWDEEKAGSIKIDGREYFLDEFHWHSPSEHTINGRRYDMEVHMVHSSANPDGTSNIAVIGVLYKIGKPDLFLSKFVTDIRAMADQVTEKNVGIVGPNEIKKPTKIFYRYLGSLTTPPCSEGVIWTIDTKVRTVSEDQIHLLKQAVYDYAEENARPLQPLNDREIQLYIPTSVGSPH